MVVTTAIARVSGVLLECGVAARLDSGLELHDFAEAIAAVVEACKDGAKVVDLCRVGDDVINK